MSKRLLFIEDLYDFYSNKYKRSTHFSSEKSGEPIVVQVHGTLNFEEVNKDTEGLLPVHLQACHTNLNLNKSNISEDSMTKALPSFKNRPILGYLHQVESEDGQWEFYGHNAHEDENGDIVYEEVPVGIIPESCNAQLVYDDEKEKTYCEIDGYIFEEYSKAADVLRREKECAVSVELSIRDMSFDAKEKCLNIEDFFFSGVTILGKNENGNAVAPGMAGSNIKLTDFNSDNNSLFSKYEDKMIEFQERLEKLESTCSNKDDSKKGGNEENMSILEELLTKYNKTVDDITFEYENLSEDELTEKFEKLFGKCGDDDKKEKCEENPEDKPDDDTNEPSEDSTDDEPSDNDDEPDNSDDNTDDDTVKEDNACGGGSGSKKKKNNSQDENITRTYELSHDDIRCALYNLLAPYEETDNDYYWIMEVFDSYFVYQGCTGKVYGQKYSKDGDNVAFDGERYELFMEYLTESEKTELESMRSNYSSISERLAQYEEAEEIADKMTVFSDEAYSKYLDTDEFKSLMAKDTLKKFTKDELIEKADAALGKLNRTHQTFSMNANKTEDKKENKIPPFLAYAKIEHESSFLDGLLKK